MPDFSVILELSRREIERHQKRFVGITVNAPEHRDINGSLEWVCDVRVGYNKDWAIIKDVTVSQWAQGIVTDMNVPVLCERGESGQVTIIARSDVHLGAIRLTTYSYNNLNLLFMQNLTLTDGTYYDGFGYAVSDPTIATATTTNYEYTTNYIEWGSTGFEYGVTDFYETETEWTES